LCNGTRKELSLFDVLFEKITSDFDEALNKRYKTLTFDQAMDKTKFDFYDSNEKEFLNLLQFQGKNNVSDVSFKFKMFSFLSLSSETNVIQ
jgi:hypothetical protein